MKLLPISILIGGLLATPLTSFAQQQNAGLTRAQVRADLIQVEKAGYNPAQRDNTKYPGDIQAAEMRIAASDQPAHDGSTAVGGSVNHTSDSGHRWTASHERNSLYGHH
ncbi:DUF4148 domain-containing protein [Caballeronia glebae]|jgi:hypothetical protein|uniref:DUF4148 domain-containing protein n=1 Tax=Caballeronia glebae TaxID=1777143 RepID=UPI000B35C9BF|nr:DUF4148 domain-containing protein [Caballeronia glebae]